MSSFPASASVLAWTRMAAIATSAVANSDESQDEREHGT